MVLGGGRHEHAPEIGALAAIAGGPKRDVSLQDGHGIIQDTVTGQGRQRVHRGVSSAGNTWWLALPSISQIGSPAVFMPSGHMATS